MKTDLLGCVIMEKDGWPADLGDSCAETGRQAVMGLQGLNLNNFVTGIGYVRHPLIPRSAPGTGENWAEPDFTGDQMLPLLMAMDLSDSYKSIREKIRKENRFVIKGSGKILQPGLFFLMRNQLNLLNLVNFIQSLIFKVPFRWSDSEKRFELSKDSSADYLNYIVTCLYLKKRGKKPIVTVSKQVLLDKVRSYLAKEPNSWWMVNLYEKAIEELFTSK